jgi:EmrB/QacA subfamily drug resistance transporter
MQSDTTERPEAEGERVSADNLSDKTRRRVLIILLLSIFMSLIDVSIVNVALPSIQHALNASLSDLQWVLSGYALTFGVVLVAAGRAGDIMGRGGIFLIGVAIFTVSSVAGGLAPSANWLNAARFVQGIGSGILNPQGVGIIQEYFRGEARGRAFGHLGTAVGFSVATGPVLGGFLIHLGGLELGWRLTFLVNLPIGIAIMVLGWMWLPKPLIRWSGGSAAKKEGRSGASLASLDPVGSVLLCLAVLAVLFPFVESRSSPLTWLLLPAGAALCLLWVKWEQRHARRGYSPMVDLNIFRTPSFANGATIMTLCFLGMSSIWVLVMLYVQEGSGKSALEAGTFGIPAALLSAYSAHWAGQRVMRFGRKIVIGGLWLAILGLASCSAIMLLHAGGHLNVWWLMASLSLIGLAQGSIITPNQVLTLDEVPVEYAGSSGAVMQTGQRIGTSVGIAIITAIVFGMLPRSSWAIAVSTGYGAIILVVFIALGFAFKDQRDRLRQPPHPRGALPPSLSPPTIE